MRKIFKIFRGVLGVRENYKCFSRILIIFLPQNFGYFSRILIIFYYWFRNVYFDTIYVKTYIGILNSKNWISKNKEINKKIKKFKSGSRFSNQPHLCPYFPLLIFEKPKSHFIKVLFMFPENIADFSGKFLDISGNYLSNIICNLIFLILNLKFWFTNT